MVFLLWEWTFWSMRRCSNEPLGSTVRSLRKYSSRFSSLAILGNVRSQRPFWQRFGLTAWRDSWFDADDSGVEFPLSTSPKALLRRADVQIWKTSKGEIKAILSDRLVILNSSLFFEREKKVLKILEPKTILQMLR